MRRLWASALFATGCLLVIVQPAAAVMQVTAQTVSSKTRTFRVLAIDDPIGTDNAIALVASGSDVAFTDRRSPGEPTALPSDCRQQLQIVFCPVPAYDGISVAAGGGNDLIETTLTYANLTPRQFFSPNVVVFMNVQLGPGADQFLGGVGTDFVLGGTGPDRIASGGGSDLIDGSAGGDRLSGGAGRDALFGRGGRDRLDGGSSKGDFLSAGSGKDVCVVQPRDFVAKCDKYVFD